MPNISIIDYLKRFKNGFNISASSIMSQDRDVTNLLSFENDFYASGYDDNPYFTFDFYKRRVLINTYSFKTFNDLYPVKWQILGSINENEWREIDRREEDICPDDKKVYKGGLTMCSISLTRTINVSNPMIVRYVRMQMLGENSCNGVNEYCKVLYLTGFRVFGNFFYSSEYCQRTKTCSKSNILLLSLINLVYAR